MFPITLAKCKAEKCASASFFAFDVASSLVYHPAEERINMRKLSLYLLCLSLVLAILCCPIRAQSPAANGIVKLDPLLDQILSAGAKLELLKGEGAFEGGEGPLWIQQGESGYLLFSDIGGNRIFQWTPECFNYPCAP
jgi:hypothetical protein